MNETRDVRSEDKIKPLKEVVELHLANMTDEDLREEWKLGNTLTESLRSELRHVERIKEIVFAELDKEGKILLRKKKREERQEKRKEVQNNAGE